MKDRRCYEIIGASSASESVVYWNSVMNPGDKPTGTYLQRLRVYVEAAGV